MNQRFDHISVCICTFRRPALLARLLESLAAQRVNPEFTFDIVVVDNDSQRSAAETVATFARKAPVAVHYDCEPEQNISLTRNRAVRNATGNLVAFIDDDEYAEPDWLLRLHQTLLHSSAAGVLGPVLPEFPAGAPQWLKRESLFDRRRLPTGAEISSKDLRIGNVLFMREIVVEDGIWFDPARGRTGGEDGDFFSRQLTKGRKFVWCDEAIATETVPEDRCTATFHLRKNLRIGTLSGERQRSARAYGAAGRRVVTLCYCLAVLPISLVAGKRVWMRVLNKLMYDIGFLSAFAGRSFVRYRE